MRHMRRRKIISQKIKLPTVRQSGTRRKELGVGKLVDFKGAPMD